MKVTQTTSRCGPIDLPHVEKWNGPAEKYCPSEIPKSRVLVEPMRDQRSTQIFNKKEVLNISAENFLLLSTLGWEYAAAEGLHLWDENVMAAVEKMSQQPTDLGRIFWKRKSDLRKTYLNYHVGSTGKSNGGEGQ